MSANSSGINIVIAIDHASITGGQAKVALESALGLKKARYNPIVFAAAAPVDPRLAEAGIEVICLDQADLLGNESKAAAAVQGTWNFRAETEMRRLLSRLKGEKTIVHVHGWAKALSASIARPIQQSGLPAVYTMHEYFMFCPNGGFYNYQQNHVCELTPLSAACWATHCDSRTYPRKVWRCLRQTVMERVARLPRTFDDFILISRFQAGVVAHRLPNGARVHAISNPIDCLDLGRKPQAASGDFLFVGRVSTEKGPLLFAEAARKAGVTPVFAGDGPALEAVRATYPEARLLGWKSPDEVKVLMRNARALVFPSLWFEGQPLTVLEAKAMGTPIIVSDGCAGREEVENGVSGLWFQSANPDSLAQSLVKAKDDALVTSMSNACYDQFWADPPTLARHVERLGAVYGEMLERRRAAA
ncbi:glycosyltransferase family 4 protein [Rhodoblastus acidophilus]|uniref:Glycosyltransferase family 4 protein n=1 Tax=Candidatus Rhodoblastus alkanivorans TaxID=2954117 RepID=A0ABS9ZBC2_9HYPH|nr:glycosyltransferase family 4 protein [Candidatus Rhodoblastus alkanivorans]MCI4679825.1 glycosyltransferase family 4 protein [Candidatus Rhodoblastus alkanivorans]MCI4684331.1 glycosyltransferase family 4 protein [Candidatus Rhodoblastus alkanivorans]MDI4641652.1 glycosyltransferase family 4 protein [Rhodoblastus acidophilus]